MAWLTAGLAAAGALKGLMDAKANQAEKQAHQEYRRTAVENSPWSGMGDPGAYQGGNTNAAGGLLQGGLQGAMVGSLFGGGAKPAADAAAGGLSAQTASNQMSFANPAAAPQMSSMDPLKNPGSWQALAKLGS